MNTSSHVERDGSMDQYKSIENVITYIETVLAFADEVHCNRVKHIKEKRHTQVLILESIEKELRRKGDSLVKSSNQKSNKEYYEILEKKKDDLLNPSYYESSQSKLFYRGLNDSKYNLLPSVFRYSKSNLEESRYENYYYRQMEVMCPDEFVGKTHFDHITMMQHYGCPTRLLDITSNPLVALYFACKKYNSNYENNGSGIVYVFAPRENELMNYSSDIVSIISCVPALTNHERERLLEASYHAVKENIMLQGNENIGVSALYGELQKELPGYSKPIDPLELLSVHFVQPTHNNRRLEKQSGAFILSGISKRDSDIERLILNNVVLAIEVQNQEKILWDLEKLGINEASLFPEIEKVAGFIKNKQKLFMKDGSLPPLE